MFISQTSSSLRSLLIAVIILLSASVLSVAYINNWYLLWLLFLIAPLLLLIIFKVSRKTHTALNKYFLNKKINTIHANLEWPSQADADNKINKDDLSIVIGNDNCTKPYKMSVYNIRVKDSLREHAVQKMASELHSIYDNEMHAEEVPAWHLVEGGKILQIGPEYIGCRTEKGGFDVRKFKHSACEESVKMVELNLSTSRKENKDIFFPAGSEYSDKASDRSELSALGFTVFSNAEGMVHFLETLQQISGGKPIGIRICIRSKKEFYRICHAIMKTGIIPDFIMVEGADKHHGFVTGNSGMPLYEALLFVSKTLQVYELDKSIKIIATADIVSGFDIVKKLALGANAICSEMPGYMVIKYHGNNSEEFLVYKGRDVIEFQESIINATARIMEANQLKSISDITLSKLLNRLDVLFAKNILEKYEFKEIQFSEKKIDAAVLKLSHNAIKKIQKHIAL